MKTIRQKAFFRQRVIKEVAKGKMVTEVANKYQISRTSIYRWKTRYDGTVESLYERSHRPHSHPNQHKAEELRLIKRVWSHNKGLGLVCLHMVLQDKHGYTRSAYSLNRVNGIGRKKQKKKKYMSKHYDTPKIPGERVQIDVKHVPSKCLAKGTPKLYQYTAVDEATRIRYRIIFDEHSNWNSVMFLHHVRKKFPFEIKCVQTDNSSEFTNALINENCSTEFEQYLKQENIKHKRIRPATPRHNGKVERVHRMDSERFYPNRKFYSAKDANEQLQRYQRWDNNFPLLVSGRKSLFQYWRDNFAKSVADQLTTYKGMWRGEWSKSIAYDKIELLEKQKKFGFNRSGTQRMVCLNCETNYTLNPKNRTYSDEIKQMAIKVYYSGVSGRGVGKVFGMSKANVNNWIKKPETVWTSKATEFGTFELDELYWFVKRKEMTKTRENTYVMTMISRIPRQIVGFNVDSSVKSRVFQEMVDSVPATKEYCTDGCMTYLDVIFGGKHIRNVRSKKDTHNIESTNADLRHYLPGFARRSRCFYRSIETLEAAVTFSYT